MKAAQIAKYTKHIEVKVNDIPIPEIGENEVLVKVKVAAVNPLEMLIITGSVKLIQDYNFPLTLGNELTGVIEKIGKKVQGFKVGDAIYSRMPLAKMGPLPNMRLSTQVPSVIYRLILILLPELQHH